MYCRSGRCHYVVWQPLFFFALLFVQSSYAQLDASDLEVRIQELYIGILGRAADKPGLDYWADQIEAGTFTLENTRAAFTDPAQAEYFEIYGGLGNTALVVAVYQNFLERDPEPAGQAYWVQELDEGRVNPDQMINAVINAVQDTSAVGAEYDRDRGVLENKTRAALYFTDLATSYAQYPLLDSFITAAQNAVNAVDEGGHTLLASRNDTDGYATEQTGRFVDFAVEGLGFATDTYEGLTGENGVFRYAPKERVTFSLGDLVLGDAPGKKLLTPYDLVPSATGIDDSKVTNILRLLQSVDSDCNPDNGITISETTRAASDIPSEIPDTVLAFENSTLIAGLLATVPCREHLVNVLDAQLHFERTIDTEFTIVREQVLALTAPGGVEPRALLDANGNVMAVLPGDPLRGEGYRIVIETSREERLIIIVDNQGLPILVIASDGSHMILGNHSPGSVDVLMVGSDDARSAGDLANAEAQRVELPPEAAGAFYRFYTPEGLTSLDTIAQASKVPPLETGIEWLDLLASRWVVPMLQAVGGVIGPRRALADDVSQFVPSTLENAGGVVKFLDITNDLLNKPSDSILGVSTVDDVTVTSLHAVTELPKKVVVGSVESAAFSNLPLTKEEQKIAALLNSGLKCGNVVKPNKFDCAAFVLEAMTLSFLAGYDLGTIAYEIYEDKDRLDALRQKLLEQDFGTYPPTISILAPADGTYVNSGSTLTFSADANQPGRYTDAAISDQDYVWTSDKDGQFGSGKVLPTNALSDGVHIVTLKVTNDDGLFAIETVSVSVGNEKPVAQITFPEPGAVFPPGEPIILSGAATDFENGDLTGDDLVWTYNGNGTVLGTGMTVTNVNLPAPAQGTFTHNIVLTATDKVGASHSVTVPVKISTLGQPFVVILTQQSEVDPGEQLVVEALPRDSQGNLLPGNSMRWVDSQGRVLGFGTTLTITAQGIGKRIIYAILTDGGVESSAEYVYSVVGDCDYYPGDTILDDQVWCDSDSSDLDSRVEVYDEYNEVGDYETAIIPHPGMLIYDRTDTLSQWGLTWCEQCGNPFEPGSRPSALEFREYWGEGILKSWTSYNIGPYGWQKMISKRRSNGTREYFISQSCVSQNHQYGLWFYTDFYDANGSYDTSTGGTPTQAQCAALRNEILSVPAPITVEETIIWQCRENPDACPANRH